MILKKLLPILLLSIFLFSCKSNEDPKPTLADRAGTYEGGGYTVIVSSEGEIQIIQNSLQVGFDMFDANSRSEDFNVGTYKVELDNDPEINDTPLSKKNNTGTIRLTLEKRVGVYELIELNATYKFELRDNGEIWLTHGATLSLAPLTKTTPSFDINSINTELNVKIVNSDYKIIFKDNNKATLEHQYFDNGTVKTLAKQ